MPHHRSEAVLAQVRSLPDAVAGLAVPVPVPVAPGGARAPADSVPAPPSDPVLAADADALRLRMAADALVLPLARAAASLVRARVWTPFGYARLDDYARERLDRSGRWVRDVAALGEGIETLPALAEAVTGADGGPPVGRVAAILITRVATADSVAAWIRLARGSTVRQLRSAVTRSRERGSPWPVGEDGEPSEGCPGAGPGEPDDTACADDQERTLVRLLVPAQIRAAFDETLELHRAVSGHDATVASFVEALVAEAYAGPHPPDVDAAPVQPGADEAWLEEILSRSTDRWAHLPPVPGADGVAAVVEGSGIEETGGGGVALDGTEDDTDARSSLDPDGRPREDVGPWALEHRLRRLIDLESRIHRRLGEVLATMGERGAWATLMFRGVRHYAEQRLGLGRSAAADRVRLHRALRRFPLVREAYERDELGLEASLSIVRLLDPLPAADPALERSWIERAREATVKRLRDETRHLGRAKLCDGPTPYATPLVPISEADDGGNPANGSPGHGEPTSARGRLARTRCSLSPLDDAEWHATLRRDPGMARDRVRAMGSVAVPREHEPLRPGAVSSGLGCPDVFLRLRLPRDLADAFLGTIECRRQDLTRLVAAVPWDEPWPDSQASASVLAARTFSNRARRVPSWVALLALLEDYVATWDDPASMPKRKADRIYRRDGWRCTAPGCGSREHLEDHHVTYRSHGGDDDEANRICLCRFHHQRGEHGELASCRGTAPLGVVWRLGRRDLSVHYRNELRLAEPRAEKTDDRAEFE